MTQEEKDLLLKDLFARLPYGTFVQFEVDGQKTIKPLTVDFFSSTWYHTEWIKPYLRPMSSITKDEEKELGNYLSTEVFLSTDGLYSVLRAQRHTSNFLYSRHLDVLGLIPMGLALEAPEDMYKTE